MTGSPWSDLHLSGLLPPFSVSKLSPSKLFSSSRPEPPHSVSMSSGSVLLGSAS
jgi:hypothetical protein